MPRQHYMGAAFHESPPEPDVLRSAVREAQTTPHGALGNITIDLEKYKGPLSNNVEDRRHPTPDIDAPQEINVNYSDPGATQQEVNPEGTGNYIPQLPTSESVPPQVMNETSAITATINAHRDWDSLPEHLRADLRRQAEQKKHLDHPFEHSGEK